LGNVGYFTAKALIEFGAVIVGICEYDGALYNENGIDPDDVLDHRRTTDSILNFSGSKMEFISPAEGLEQPCDILVPAALENQITEENIHRIQAKIIAEGANGPTTPGAAAAFIKSGRLII